MSSSEIIKGSLESLNFDDVESIRIIGEACKRDLPIEELEELEALLKLVLQNIMARPVSGTTARRLAVLMKDIGLFFKYKPYAVKASHPLGYSIFLQRLGEGFSFQNHLEHKTEVFHILEAMPGGYVFLCKYEDWQEHYEPTLFVEWMNGKSHPFFDRCKFVPSPGDVFIISELGIVHTIIGCVLEEFATASTDMVQRLHDQNERDRIPDFPREETNRKLRSLTLPDSSRFVDLLGSDIEIKHLPAEELDYGQRVVLTDTFVGAFQHRVRGHMSTPFMHDPKRAALLRVFDGQCRIDLRDSRELSGAGDFGIDAGSGDVITISPGIHFQIINNSASTVKVSEHRIEPAVAFI